MITSDQLPDRLAVGQERHGPARMVEMADFPIRYPQMMQDGGPQVIGYQGAILWMFGLAGG